MINEVRYEPRESDPKIELKIGVIELTSDFKRDENDDIVKDSNDKPIKIIFLKPRGEGSFFDKERTGESREGNVAADLINKVFYKDVSGERVKFKPGIYSCTEEEWRKDDTGAAARLFDEIKKNKRVIISFEDLSPNKDIMKGLKCLLAPGAIAGMPLGPGGAPGMPGMSGGMSGGGMPGTPIGGIGPVGGIGGGLGGGLSGGIGGMGSSPIAGAGGGPSAPGPIKSHYYLDDVKNYLNLWESHKDEV